MISLRCVKSYCCEDISLIENYDKAISDDSQSWHCHHRLETDMNMLAEELIEKNLYYNRSASELIFLTSIEHIKLHAHNKTDITIERLSKSHKNKIHPDSVRQKISANNCMKDSNVRLKVSNTLMGHIGANLGRHRVYRDDGSWYMSY